MEFVLVGLFLGKRLVSLGLNDGARKKRKMKMMDADIVEG